MIQKVKSEDRFLAQHSWLHSYHLFSFADYYDQENINFGVLRVFNDDRIDGESGFGEHSHSNMEIVTVVLDGELTHKDGMGNVGVIKAGDVQYMSAGFGVTHAEMNEAKEPVHLYQIWLLPKDKNIKPTYEQKNFSDVSKKNILLPVASDKKTGGELFIKTDATIYLSELETGETIKYEIAHNRGVFVYISHGILDINGIPFNAGDQARISDEKEIIITSTKDAKFIFIDVLMII